MKRADERVSKKPDKKNKVNGKIEGPLNSELSKKTSPKNKTAMDSKTSEKPTKEKELKNSVDGYKKAISNKMEKQANEKTKVPLHSGLSKKTHPKSKTVMDCKTSLSENPTKEKEAKNSVSGYKKGVSNPVEKLAFSNYNEEHYNDLDLDELRDLVDKMKIEISEGDAQSVEQLTQTQAKNEHWYKFRTGRITASNFKSACSTKIQKPSLITIKKICHPKLYHTDCKALAYGRIHESIAYDEFCDFMHLSHTNFQCRTSGLILNGDYPYFGASPDGLCSCDCCGKSCLEIKCPYTLRSGENISTLLNLTDPYLLKVNGQYEINKKHCYYYQIQMQIFVCNVQFCNFYIWSENESLALKVVKDDEFWTKNSQKAVEFSKNVLLPEMLGQYYTKKDTPSKEEMEDEGRC